MQIIYKKLTNPHISNSTIVTEIPIRKLAGSQLEEDIRNFAYDSAEELETTSEENFETCEVDLDKIYKDIADFAIDTIQINARYVGSVKSENGRNKILISIDKGYADDLCEEYETDDITMTVLFALADTLGVNDNGDDNKLFFDTADALYNAWIDAGNDEIISEYYGVLEFY